MEAPATEREQELFCRCLDQPEAERRRWLADACSTQPELRLRIERLLAAHSEAEHLCLDEDLVFTEAMEGYWIVRVIGEGGMGVVYEALQEEPLRRRVAIKAIRPGLASTETLARFRTERHALAAMDHPNIAKVFEAGTTRNGRPYFVMEFVEGLPLLRFCEQHGFGIAQRLRLFTEVCHAVQHAHQKGVIHRDLKPGNILVGGDASTARPRIIDFGIARALIEDLDIRLTRTTAGSMPGTPAYMSPEQAGYGGLDVDTRSDVYSLGVVLYELLTGELPAAGSGELPPGEFLHRLASGNLDPVAPSARVPALRGDIDAILLKALATERDLRYPTALAMAEDLQRHLNGRPVSARAPTRVYRARKYWQRHRVQVLAASAAMISLFSGVAAGGYGLLQARRAEVAAHQEAQTARQVSGFLTRLFTLSDPNRTPGSTMTIRQVLDEGTKRIERELESSPEVQAALMGTLAHVHESVGSYRTAKSLAERALASRHSRNDAETGETLITLGRTAHRLGEFDKARQAIERAIEVRSRVFGIDSIEVAEALNLLGGVEGQLEHFRDAEAAHRRALTIQQRVKGADHIATYNSWRGLGLLFDRQGHFAEALRCFERILPIARKRYGSEHPVVADALHNIGLELDELGRLAEAEAVFSQALAMLRNIHRSDHPALAFTLGGLAQVLRKQGRLQQAEPLLRDALRIREHALGPDNVRTAESRNSLGLLRIEMGVVDEGSALAKRAVAALEKAYGPKHTQVLKAHRDLGLALYEVGRYAAAARYLERVSHPNTPPRLRVDLSDKRFGRLHRSGAVAVASVRPKL